MCFISALQRLHHEENGATATEYIIMLVLIACFVIAIVRVFGGTLSEKYGWADERVFKFVTF